MEPCSELSIQRQCELVGISRSGFYYQPAPESPENLALMRRLDQFQLEYPVYGGRRLTALLQRQGQGVNRNRVVRLLQAMGLEAVYPKRCLSQPGEGHRIYPYLLEGLEISGSDQVWCCDITYVPTAYGFMFLVAVMDWWSRYVAAWELSKSLDSEFCIRAWTTALATGRQPLISNTDQGSQFTSEAYLEAVEAVGVDVSMDGLSNNDQNAEQLSKDWRRCSTEGCRTYSLGPPTVRFHASDSEPGATRSNGPFWRTCSRGLLPAARPSTSSTSPLWNSTLIRNSLKSREHPLANRSCHDLSRSGVAFHPGQAASTSAQQFTCLQVEAKRCIHLST